MVEWLRRVDVGGDELSWIACQAPLSGRTSISLDHWTGVVFWPTEVASVILPAARDLVSTMRLARDVATAVARSVIKTTDAGCKGPVWPVQFAEGHLLSVPWLT